MELSPKDKVPNLSEIFWTYLAPGFLIKIRDQFRTWRLKRYKMRKVKESKLIHDEDYYMEFNIIVDDGHNPQCIGPFNITIPAKGAYFAKRKLKVHVKEVVDVDVLHIDRSDNPHVVYSRNTESSMYNVLLYSGVGELVDVVKGVQATSSREAYLKVNPFVVEHAMWDAVKQEEMS
jgi:hypothetical protein